MVLARQFFAPRPAGESFSFGLEAEYLLVSLPDYRPLWHPDVTFETLNRCLEAIPVSDLIPCEGMALNPPHRRAMPYGIEGYHVFDDSGVPFDILPKGIEIRTPRAESLEECLGLFESLYDRLQHALGAIGLRAVALSFHPTASSFEGPRQTRSEAYWPWAKQAMVTYGPDLNVSLPEALYRRLDLADLERKVDYYAPAVTALGLASPILDGDLWRIDGVTGRSVRTFRRSLVGAMVEWHPDEGRRLELKPFEMASATEDFLNYFLIWLSLLLDEGLDGRSTPEARVRELREVAIHGLEVEWAIRRASTLLDRAPHVLEPRGFPCGTLESFQWRLDRRRTPADSIVEAVESGEALSQLLRARGELERLGGATLPCVAPSVEALASASLAG